MRDTERTEIDGHIYQVTHLKTKDAERVRLRLIKALGAAMGQVKDADDWTTLVIKAFQGLSNGVSEADYDFVRDKMVECTTYIKSGGDLEVPIPLAKIYDNHFKGRNIAQMKWLYFALQVNFADFLGDSVRGMIVAFIKANLFPSPSPKESSGDDGGPSLKDTPP